MEYSDTGVTKFAIGIPTTEEKKRLIEEKYIFSSKGKTVPDEDGNTGEYEVWYK